MRCRILALILAAGFVTACGGGGSNPRALPNVVPTASSSPPSLSPSPSFTTPATFDAMVAAALCEGTTHLDGLSSIGNAQAIACTVDSTVQNSNVTLIFVPDLTDAAAAFQQASSSAGSYAWTNGHIGVSAGNGNSEFVEAVGRRLGMTDIDEYSDPSPRVPGYHSYADAVSNCDHTASLNLEGPVNDQAALCYPSATASPFFSLFFNASPFKADDDFVKVFAADSNVYICGNVATIASVGYPDNDQAARRAARGAGCPHAENLHR